MNSIQRSGKLTLDPLGTLKGEVSETQSEIAPGQSAGAWVP